MRQKNLGNTLIRIDGVPKGVSSSVFERIKTQIGDIFVREYDHARMCSPTRLFKRVTDDLGGELGHELVRLRSYGLHPVLFADFDEKLVDLFRVELSADLLARRKRTGQGIVVPAPAMQADGIDGWGIEFPSDVVATLSRYGFDVEIVGYGFFKG